MEYGMGSSSGQVLMGSALAHPVEGVVFGAFQQAFWSPLLGIFLDGP